MAYRRRKAGNMVRDGQAEAAEAEEFSRVPIEARSIRSLGSTVEGSGEPP